MSKNERLLKVQVVDMEPEIREQAEAEILNIFDTYSKEEKIAHEMKKFMDKISQGWNVVVGKSFGSHVINQTKCYMFASYRNDEISILIWKS